MKFATGAGNGGRGTLEESRLANSAAGKKSCWKVGRRDGEGRRPLVKLVLSEKQERIVYYPQTGPLSQLRKYAPLRVARTKRILKKMFRRGGRGERRGTSKRGRRSVGGLPQNETELLQTSKPGPAGGGSEKRRRRSMKGEHPAS